MSNPIESTNNVPTTVNVTVQPSPPKERFYQSRRFLVLVVAIFIGVLIHFVPVLAEYSDTLTGLITTVALVAIAGYSVEDAISASKRQPGDFRAEDFIPLVVTLLESISGIVADTRNRFDGEEPPDA